MSAQTSKRKAIRTPHGSEGPTPQSPRPNPQFAIRNSQSPARLRANRANAQRSTGPRSPDGKARASQNAAKHGLCSSEALITAGRGAEDPAQFEALLARTREAYRPDGPLQHSLVERIADCTWRLARAQRFEAAAIHKAIDLGDPPPDSDQPDLEEEIAVAEHRLSQLRDTLDDLTDDSTRKGTYLMARLVEALREVALQYRWVSPQDRWRPPGDEFWQRLLDLMPINGKWKALADAQTYIIEREERRLARLRARREYFEHERSFREECAHLLNALPAPDQLKLLIRYETMIDRRLQRSIAHLERLQGCPIPHPPQAERGGGREDSPAGDCRPEDSQPVGCPIPHPPQADRGGGGEDSLCNDRPPKHAKPAITLPKCSFSERTHGALGKMALIRKPGRAHRLAGHDTSHFRLPTPHFRLPTSHFRLGSGQPPGHGQPQPLLSTHRSSRTLLFARSLVASRVTALRGVSERSGTWNVNASNDAQAWEV